MPQVASQNSSSKAYSSLAERFKRGGQLSLEMLIFSGAALVLIGGFVLWAGSFLNLSLRDFNKTSAFSIAESGIEYYRWHLAHAPTDYQDGTGQPGPYVHSYFDKDGNLLGSFTLEITPPLPGSTVVTVKSTGRVVSDNTVAKIIQVKMGVPSYAKYAWLLNDNVVFGTTAQVYGPIHSNAGVHFDGVAHNLVTSALTTYTDPDTGKNEWAVYTLKSPSDPQPPTPLPSRPDVFMAGRQIGVPAVDFNALTQTLSQIRSSAQTGGFYRPSSTSQGYDVLLKTNGTFDLYKVTAQVSPPRGCAVSQTGWGTWSVQNESFLGNYPYPTSGLMFFEDNIWVRGQINNVRLTIASGRFPDPITNRSNITVNNNLLYTNFDGRDVISLIAQNNINVGLKSDDNLIINGALVAENGWVGRYYYSSKCGSTSSRTSLTTYGMIATNLRSGFYYSSSNGYQARQYNYDANLLYGPPPSFPQTSDQYVQISWDEVK